MPDIKKVYEEYWDSKEGLEDFSDYERNQALKLLIKTGDQILDIASGEGAVSEFMKNLGGQVTAFDISDVALAKAKKRGVKTVQGDVEKKLSFKSNSFDVVFWGDNAEHLFDPSKTLKEIYRVLKPSGRLIISCPNMGYWRYRLDYLLNGMVPKTEWFREHPWQWEHIRFFNKSVMEQFLVAHQFQVNRFIGVSRRRMDQPLKDILPELLGMIMVVEATKNV